RLGVGSERSPRGIDRAAPRLGLDLERALAGHPRLHTREDLAVPVLAVDQLREPVVEQEIELGCRDRERPLDRLGYGRGLDHQRGQRGGRGLEEVVQVPPLELDRAIGQRHVFEESVPSHLVARARLLGRSSRREHPSQHTCVPGGRAGSSPPGRGGGRAVAHPARPLRSRRRGTRAAYGAWTFCTRGVRRASARPSCGRGGRTSCTRASRAPVSTTPARTVGQAATAFFTSLSFVLRPGFPRLSWYTMIVPARRAPSLLWTGGA